MSLDKLTELQKALENVGPIYDDKIKDAVKTAKELIADKNEQVKKKLQLTHIIGWLTKLTRAHKIKWYNITPGIYASTEAHFLGFHICIMNKFASYASVELHSMVSLDRPLSLEEMTQKPIGGKPVYYLCVTHEDTRDKFIDMVEHENLEMLKREAYRHMNCPEGDGLDYFYKSVKRASEDLERDPSSTWG